MSTVGDQTIDTDVLVIGGGLGGGFAAVKARESGAETVSIVEKGRLGRTGASGFAAGVITTFLPEDDLDAWLEAGVLGADYLLDQDMAQLFLEEGHLGIRDLENWELRFAKQDGKYERIFARGGNPERPSIKTMMIPGGGTRLMDAVTGQAAKAGVRLVNRVMLTDLLTRDGRVVGAVGFDVRTGSFIVVRAKATVIASGGVMFKSGYHSNRNLTGDGHAMAFRAGAELADYEFLSHHVTSPQFDLLGFMMFLGLGGKFANASGEQFLARYDPVLKDRTQLGILAGAIAIEHRQGRGPCYIDLTHFSLEQVRRLRQMVPLFVKIGERAGFVDGDRVIKKIELVPSTQGNGNSGGGLRVNRHFESSLPGLFAAGSGAAAVKASCAGVTALAGCPVSGSRAGRSAALWAKTVPYQEIDNRQVRDLRGVCYEDMQRGYGAEPEVVITRLQETILSEGVFVISNDERLRGALSEVEDIRDTLLPRLIAYDPHYLALAHEARNMVLCAEIWLRSALERKESRSREGFWREDYPFTDNVDWLKWSVVKRQTGGISITHEPVPLDRYKRRPEKRERFTPQLFLAAEGRGG